MLSMLSQVLCNINENSVSNVLSVWGGGGGKASKHTPVHFEDLTWDKAQSATSIHITFASNYFNKNTNKNKICMASPVLEHTYISRPKILKYQALSFPNT